MFDWNEDEEVTDTIWGVLNENEDHIVPYPKENEAEYSKNQRNETTTATNLIASLDQTKSDSKNEFPDEGTSEFDPNEELSVSRFDLDPWPDLPSLNSTFGNYARSTPIVNASTSIVNGLYDSASAIVETKDNSLKDPCSQPGSSFLDCDWGNIADFDDFDRIFRNEDSLFQHEIISHGDGDGSVPTSFSIPDLRENKENAGEKRDEQLAANPSNNDDVDDHAMADCGNRDHSPDRIEKQMKTSKSRKKMEEKNTSIVPQVLPPSESYRFFRPSVEYPGPKVYQASWKHQSMTPQEKIEKLRRRQQMQAMLAIQQQQQQIEQKKSSSTEMSATQLNPSLGSEEGEDLQNSFLIDDSLGEKIFYQLQDVVTKLEVEVRLCIRDSLLRLAKSAVERTNAREWSSTNKSSREEKEGSIEECNIMSERSMKLPTETGTNPIDRIVAHLLFHWPSEQTSRIVKEEVMQSPSFPASNFGEGVSLGKLDIEDLPEAQDRGP